MNVRGTARNQLRGHSQEGHGCCNRDLPSVLSDAQRGVKNSFGRRGDPESFQVEVGPLQELLSPRLAVPAYGRLLNKKQD